MEILIIQPLSIPQAAVIKRNFSKFKCLKRRRRKVPESFKVKGFTICEVESFLMKVWLKLLKDYYVIMQIG